MSGEAIVVIGAQKTLESSGGQIAADAVVIASVAPYNMQTDGAAFPDAEFVLTCSFATAPASNSTVSLYAQALLIDGTTSAEAPVSSRPGLFIGTFGIRSTANSQAIPLTGVFARDLPRNANYYLHNNTAVTMNAGWSLKATPRSYKAAV